MLLRDVRAAMRGQSAWTIGERELMAAMVAKWSACRYCADVHGAVAATHLGDASVAAVFSNYRSAPISAGLKATLEFLETMTLRPAELTDRDATAVRLSGVSDQSLEDAITVGATFNLIARYVNALGITIPAVDRHRRLAERAVARQELRSGMR